jgi:anaphase-promoting complex subunit 10
MYVCIVADVSRASLLTCTPPGTTFHDLEEVFLLDLEEPTGWVYVPVGTAANHGGQGVLRCHFLQIEVLAMHQSGRDTHIRQVKVFGPRRSVGQQRTLFAPSDTVEMGQFSCIR